MHIVGADCSGGRGEALLTEAREGGIIEEIRLDTCIQNPQRSASMLDLILYEKCRAEPNLTLLLNTAVVGVEKKGGRIESAIAERQSTEDRFRIQAQVFIDCTGDGRLGAEAGAAYRHGRETKGEHGEPLGQDEADRKTLGSTLLFQARDIGRPAPFTAPSWARPFSEEDLALRPHAEKGVDTDLEYGYWWVEWGGELDTVKDNETIRDELLAVVLGVWDHIKNGGDHGAANWALDWIGFLPGKRESRRFVGQHTLAEADVLGSVSFPDAIAYGGWYIDTHPPGGVDALGEAPCTQHPVEHLYDIPLRACVSRDVENLLFAGRNISATHIAFASTRVMATCAAMGQGVGTAAAHAVKCGMAPANLAADSTQLRAIQQRLVRDDAYLIGIRNEEAGDLARQARVSASSHQPDGPPKNVLSGQTRAVHGTPGAPPERAHPGTHRWMSDAAEGLPAWLLLEWDEPVAVQEVQLVFDTGLHRVLTLTHSDTYARMMRWGEAQPETVSKYAVEGCCGGVWETLVETEGNYQRKRVHTVKATAPLEALRITIHHTNGLDHARIAEVRVY